MRLVQVVRREYDIWEVGLSRGHVRDDWTGVTFFLSARNAIVPNSDACADVILDNPILDKHYLMQGIPRVNIRTVHVLAQEGSQKYV